MFGRSPDVDPLTEENCEFLYRPPTNGEEPVHAHRVERITQRQVKVEKVAVDGTLAHPEKDREGTWTLSRQELEEHGSTTHGIPQVRFYVDQEAAKAAT